MEKQKVLKNIAGAGILITCVTGCGVFPADGKSAFDGNSALDDKPVSGGGETPVVHEEEIVVPGLKEEFEILFMADTHISLCDERDEGLLDKARARYEGFRGPSQKGAEETFRGLMEYAALEEPDLLVLGGDILDSAMWASLDFLKERLDELGLPWVYAMGNHDFEYGEEYFSEKAYTDYLPRFGSVSDTTDGYQLWEHEDFTILAVDDKSNKVSGKAADALEALCEKNKPVILVMHVPVEPLEDDVLLEESKEVWGTNQDGNSKVLLGPRSCVPDGDTRRFLDLALSEESPVVLVLAGHIHFYHRDILTGDLVQIVTGAGYENELVKVVLKP